MNGLVAEDIRTKLLQIDKQFLGRTIQTPHGDIAYHFTLNNQKVRYHLQKAYTPKNWFYSEYRTNFLTNFFGHLFHDMHNYNFCCVTQRLIGWKWRIDWFSVIYNQSTVNLWWNVRHCSVASPAASTEKWRRLGCSILYPYRGWTNFSRGYSEKNFQGFLEKFSDISRGKWWRKWNCSFSKGLDDQASSTYISFFQGVG